MSMRTYRQTTVRTTRIRLARLALVVLGGAAIGCSGDTANGPAIQTNRNQLYWALQFPAHAVVLALTPPYDTLQLTAVPVNPDGIPLTGRGTVTYHALDSAIHVSATGLVTARSVTAAAHLAATLQDQVHRITHTDTVTIQVTQARDSIETYSMQPAPNDSAKRALDASDTLTFVPQQYSWAALVVAAGHDTLCTPSNPTVCAIPVSYTSSDPRIANIDATGEVQNNDTGHVVFTASTLAYGKLLRDSVHFTVGYAINEQFIISYNSSIVRHDSIGFQAPRQVVIGVGAIVSFGNLTFEPVNILFDDTVGVDTSSSYLCPLIVCVFGPPTVGGNVAAFGGNYNVDSSAAGVPLDSSTSLFNPDNWAGRLFRRAGVYHVYSPVFAWDTLTLTIK